MSVILHLQLVTAGPTSPDQRARSLSEGELRIGREPDNDWVLEDEARLISRHHCTITAHAGLFTLIDTSNNGVFLNESERPLGRGNSVILSAGDRLHLGELTLDVSMTTQQDDTDAFGALLPPSGAPDRRTIDTPDLGGARMPPRVAQEPLPPAPLSAPLRRSAGGLFGGFDTEDLGQSAFGSTGGAPAAPALGRLGEWAPDLGAAWSPPRQLFADLPVEPLETPGTPADHLPVEEEALPPMRISPQKIPDDWDPLLETGTGDAAAFPAWSTPAAPADVAAPVFPFPDLSLPDLSLPPATAPAAIPAPPPSALLLSCIEALALIEAAAAPEGQARVLAGPPAEVAARLAQEDPDWVALLLVGLSADVAARLAHARPPMRDPSASPLPLPDRPGWTARDPGDTSQ